MKNLKNLKTKCLSRHISMLLTICMIVSMFAVSPICAEAADGITVNIVSFNRGAQTDLRSSELLAVEVTGYDGNAHDLIYEWTSTLGTYLYVYNSHNMYGINNTDGEIEIYNKKVSSSANMAGRSYKDTFTGKGFGWAAIYGANLTKDSLVGIVTVKVYDDNGNLLGSDTHEGKKKANKTSGFVQPDLKADLSEIAFGMFEGDTKHINDLLGEAGLVHVTCEECKVSNATIVSGQSNIKIVSSGGISSIQGLQKGVSEVSIKVTKSNCKFHQDVSITTTVKIYVYRKPTTTSTATKIELRNLDNDCVYRINHVNGIRGTDEDGNEIVIFENLTPNTEYQIGVIGGLNGDLHDPVYAFVYETTKPAHTGTVEVILNGTYDMSTSTATGERVNISTVMENCQNLYFRYDGSELYFPLENTQTGIYSTVLSDGNYTIHSAQTPSAQIGDQALTIAGSSRTRYLFFNSVQYNLGGGTGGPDKLTEYHLGFSTVYVSDKAPTKEGYIFSHWSDAKGKIYYPGQILVEDISEAYTLTANYVEATDVYVNIKINHIADSGDHNSDKAQHDITFTVDSRDNSESDYTELITKTIDWDGKSEFNYNEFTAVYVDNDSEDYTVYTSKTPILTNVEKAKEYTITTSKSGYRRESITTSIDENGNYYINAEYIYEPNRFDMAFSVELDEEAKSVADEFKPVAVNVKVLQWYDYPYDDEDTVGWYTTSRQRYTYERIALGSDGIGTGTFPVPYKTTDELAHYHYRLEVVSYELADGTILNASDANNDHITYVADGKRYLAEIVVTDGFAPSGSTLTGVCYDGTTQEGTLKAVVSIEVFDVTIDPNGGRINSSSNNVLLKDQIKVPDLTQYTPVRDGGYIFDGWYYKDNTPANSGDEIDSDVEIIAKWKEPLTVNGAVTVSATYRVYNAETGVSYTQTIPEISRATSVYVALQRIDHTGYPETVALLSVPVTYSTSTGKGTYEFTEIPNNGHEYRIKVLLANYDTLYQNAESSEFTENNYTAIFKSENTATVNASLVFNPASFNLQYEINASYLGEEFRPEKVETLILYNDGSSSNPQDWAIVSQMTEGGQNTTLADGVGTNSLSVWSEKPDGVTLYEYSIKVKSYTKDGQTIQLENADVPFRITYNGSARYDEVTGQTQTLVAMIVPKMYTITYDMGDIGEDTITGMEDYLDMSEENFTDYYYWSRGKAITATPVREGYTFAGWYNENSEAVTQVEASMSGNITLYAKWLIAPEFETLADAGYYSEEKGGSGKDGVIALNARIKNITEVADYVVKFGMYIYNQFSEEVITTESEEISTVIADGGEYHVLISNIAEGNFAKEVFAMPFVILDTDFGSKVYFGERFGTSVQAINKWLGSSN